MSTGTVKLENAVFYAHHGVTQEEHRIGGRFEVDVVMEVPFTEAAKEDNLAKTVDYEKIYQLVKEIVTQNNFYLIERLAYLISQRVLDDHSIVSSVQVTVRKPNPPVGGPCDRAVAVFQLHRDETI